jgi:hypothetical protein
LNFQQWKSYVFIKILLSLAPGKFWITTADNNHNSRKWLTDLKEKLKYLTLQEAVSEAISVIARKQRSLFGSLSS